MQSVSVIQETALPWPSLPHVYDPRLAPRHRRDMPSPIAARAAHKCIIRAFKKDQQIFGEGIVAEFSAQVVTGAVRMSKLLGDGRRQIDAFHLAGGFFGIESGPEHRFSAEATVNTTVRVYRFGDLDSIAADGQFAGKAVFAALVQSLECAQDHALLLGKKSAREKVSTFVLDLAERLASDKTIDLPMSRMDIADYLGLTIETVSRTLTQLQRDGIIDLPCRRRAIVLRNKSALRRLANGDVDFTLSGTG
ncbi:MAG: helix-turn-helix domain-containing protein [Beijerinckiaceae bacterium]|nr:helix-turn-helix domain-containing protein [Beijerinckiaceae bacterium]